MYKIINLAGRISLFFVIEVAMYYAMFDPLLHIVFGLPDRPALLIASHRRYDSPRFQLRQGHRCPRQINFGGNTP